MFLLILRLTTKMKGYFTEDMFKHYPYVILRYDVLDGVVGKGCGRTKYGVGNGLVKCPGHDGGSLTVFVME